MQYAVSKYYISQFKKIRYEWVVIFCSFLPKSCSLGLSMMRPHLNTLIFFVFLVLIFLSQITLGLFLPKKKICSLKHSLVYEGQKKAKQRFFQVGSSVHMSYHILIGLLLS